MPLRNTPNESLGDILRDWRVRENLTQEELADSLGIARHAVYQMEKGMSGTTTYARHWRKIAARLPEVRPLLRELGVLAPEGVADKPCVSPPPLRAKAADREPIVLKPVGGTPDPIVLAKADLACRVARLMFPAFESGHSFIEDLAAALMRISDLTLVKMHTELRG